MRELPSGMQVATYGSRCEFRDTILGRDTDREHFLQAISRM
jgi:hypothetical protein